MAGSVGQERRLTGRCQQDGEVRRTPFPHSDPLLPRPGPGQVLGEYWRLRLVLLSTQGGDAAFHTSCQPEPPWEFCARPAGVETPTFQRSSPSWAPRLRLQQLCRKAGTSAGYGQGETNPRSRLGPGRIENHLAVERLWGSPQPTVPSLRLKCCH